jgi:hypothetical protein
MEIRDYGKTVILRAFARTPSYMNMDQSGKMSMVTTSKLIWEEEFPVEKFTKDLLLEKEPTDMAYFYHGIWHSAVPPDVKKIWEEYLDGKK